jgi:hypothetical protein
MAAEGDPLKAFCRQTAHAWRSRAGHCRHQRSLPTSSHNR